MEKQINKSNEISFSAIMFFIYSFYYISGYSSKIHNYVIFALFSLWLIIAVLENRKAFLYSISTKPFLFLLLFFAYYIITSFIVGPLDYILEYIGLFTFLYGLFFQARYYMYKGNTKEIKFLVFSVIFAFLVFSVNAVRFYIMVPSAARTLASDFYAYDNIAIGGGYSIAFGSSILFVYLFELLVRREPKTEKYKAMIVVMLLLLGLLIFKTESTITIIATLCGTIAAFMSKSFKGNIEQGGIDNSRNSKARMILTVILTTIVVLFLFLNAQSISLKLIGFTNSRANNVVFRRINRIVQKIYYMSSGASHKNYVDIRLGTVKYSWNTFLKYPFFGVGYKCGNVFSSLEEYGVGTHSELVDLLAQHGIIGGSLWLLFLISAIKNNINTNRHKSYLVSFLIMITLNPFKTFHGYCVLLFVIPLIDYLMNNNYEEEKNEI